jgi:hypothetical protein
LLKASLHAAEPIDLVGTPLGVQRPVSLTAGMAASGSEIAARLDVP